MNRLLIAGGGAVAGLAFVCPAQAAFPIFGSLPYDPATNTGYDTTNTGRLSAGNGVALGQGGTKLQVGSALRQVLRWDATGVAVALPNFSPTDTTGTQSSAGAINDAGTVVGQAFKADASGGGLRPARWDAAGQITELGNLGEVAGSVPMVSPSLINNVGDAAGTAIKFENGTSRGMRPVSWFAGTTQAVERGVLGTSSSGMGRGQPLALAADGTLVGFSTRYVNSVNLGSRAVRWDNNLTDGTDVTELDPLGFDADGRTTAAAIGINDAGTIVGQAMAFNGTSGAGTAAVRWDAGGNAVTRLGDLAPAGVGLPESSANVINEAGTIIGTSTKYSATGSLLGPRAVRWDAGSTTPVELGLLGSYSSGVSSSEALDINSVGLIVGSAHRYTIGGTDLGSFATLWGPDGVAINLNTLIDPTLGWTLTNATSISDSNWVVGVGNFDPDGSGPLAAYQRGFLMQVPEPATIVLAAVALWPLRRRREA